MRPEELVVAVGDAEEREAEGVGFKEGDDQGKGEDGSKRLGE